jgi:hypothetical protein
MPSAASAEITGEVVGGGPAFDRMGAVFTGLAPATGCAELDGWSVTSPMTGVAVASLVVAGLDSVETIGAAARADTAAPVGASLAANRAMAQIGMAAAIRAWAGKSLRAPTATAPSLVTDIR